MLKEVFIVSAVRSPIGDFGGALRAVAPIDLAVPVTKAALKRAKLAAEQVGKIILGNTLSPLTPNIARGVAISCGIPAEKPAFSIHCACASAMQAVISGVSALILGEAETAVVGGVESMSNTPYVMTSARWGQRLRHAQATDLLWWGMQEDPIMGGMGLAADFLAAEYGISRQELDELAAQSHSKAVTAQEEGRFENEIVPIVLRGKSKETVVTRDEHPRKDATIEKLGALNPAFSPNGTATAGNASGINDGASAIVLATQKACESYGLEPMAKIGLWSIKAAEPKYTGIAPVPAIREVLDRSGLTVADMDLIEVNEAFAAYYLACERDLKLDREKVNVNGSGISLGHPVGATGARLVVTLLHELIRRGGNLGLASLCAGGGMGYALLVRRDR